MPLPVSLFDDWHDAPMTQRNRPTGGRGAETRAALLRAAVAVVDREGLDAVTTRRVAEEAGLPHGTVHYWFADKADLLRGVMEVMLTDARATILDGQGDQTLGEILTHIHEGFAELPMGRQLALLEFTLSAARTESLKPLAQQLYDVYTSSAHVTLQPWADRVEEVLPGGTAALAPLIVAVIDGLTLSGIAGSDTRGLTAALNLFTHLLDRALAAGATPQN